MRKRSEAGKPVPVLRKRSEARTVAPIIAWRTWEEARYAWRERLALSEDGGARPKIARRLADAAVPDFAIEAKAGAFDFDTR